MTEPNPFELSFQNGEGVFSDREAFAPNRHRGDRVKRTAEFEQLQAELRPLVDGTTGANVAITGKPGTGKSLVVSDAVEWLEQSADHSSLSVVNLGCSSLSSYMFALKLANALRPSDKQISQRGHSKATIVDRLQTTLADRDAPLLIVMDQLQRLDIDEEFSVLQDLATGGIAEMPPVQLLGVLTTSTTETPPIAELFDELIQFEPYTASELEAILLDAADGGVRPEAYSEAVLSHAAELAANPTDKHGGSARRALRVMTNAGDRADADGTDEITEDHVTIAYDRLTADTETRIRNILSDHERCVLDAALDVAVEQGTPIRVTDVYSVYRQRATEYDIDTRPKRTVSDKLSMLALVGALTKREVTTSRTGTTVQYDLRVSPEKTRAMVTEVERDE